MTSMIDLILSSIPSEVLKTKTETHRGLLFCPNDDFMIGPKFLIALNYPLNICDQDWAENTQYLGGADEKLCKSFFMQCNGFDIGGRFVAPGIITPTSFQIDELN